MQDFKIIKHQDISDDEVLEICNIKSAFGAHSTESQKEWMSDHLKENDIHFLLYENEEFVAYLNLVDISISINNKLIHAFGIGNVCSKIRGCGYGKKLMNELNSFLLLNNEVGYLFCKNSLVKFYKQCGWFIIDSDKSVIFPSCEIKSMLFNYNENIDFLEYDGELF